MDANQRPDSRGGPEGEGKGRQSGSPEGPESRPGPPQALGRKLPGEFQRCWSSVFICLESVSGVYSRARVSVRRRRSIGLNCDSNVTLAPAEARQPRDGFIAGVNYQRAAAERQIHASSVLLQCPQGEKAVNSSLRRMRPVAAWLWIATSPCRCLHEGTNAEPCVRQINHFHKSEDRAVLITDRHLYKLDPLKQYQLMKTLPLYNVGYFMFNCL